MNWLHRLRSWAGWDQRSSFERAMSAEIRFHIEQATEDYIAQGMTPSDARRRARREFGSIELAKEDLRDTRRMRWFTDLTQDVRYSFRAIARQPSVSITVALTIAIGVGASTSMYGVMERLLLAPPPGVANPNLVFKLHWLNPDSTAPAEPFTHTSYGLFKFIGQNAQDVEAITAYMTDRAITFKQLGPENRTTAMSAQARLVGPGFWRVLGAAPAMGRLMQDEEMNPATGSRVVILGDAFWRSQFGGDPSVLGTALEIRGEPYEIIGVVPRGFRGVDLAEVDLWLPLSAYRNEFGPPWYEQDTGYFVSLAVRLRPDISSERVTAELTQLQRAFSAQAYSIFGERSRSRFTRARAMLGPITGALGPNLKLIPEARVTRWLVGIAFVLLLIACSNVAGLLLLRAMRRRREIAVRLALGVSWARLARQFLTESSVLALLGGIAAIGFTITAGAWLERTILPGLNADPASFMEPGVALVAVISILGAAFVSGLAPLAYAKSDVAVGLRSGAFGGSARRPLLQQVLLGTQGVLSVVLLVGAGLFLRSLYILNTQDIGLDRDRSLVVLADFSGAGRPAADAAKFFEQALARVASLPDVDSAGLALMPPLRGAMKSGQLEVKGSKVPGTGAWVNYVSPGYFEAAGMRLVEGRSFDERERAMDGVIVVNRMMAKHYWPDRSPLGECVNIERVQGCATVVGVVEDANVLHIVSETKEDRYYFYRPLDPAGLGSQSMVVRLATGSTAGEKSIRDALQSMDGDLPYIRIERMDAPFDKEIRPWQLGAAVFTSFGVLAMILAAIGLATAVAFSVSQRTKEFGIRIALGATGVSLAKMVLGDALRNAAIAVGTGLLCSLVLARYLADLLFEVSPNDPAVFTAVAAGVFLIATVASFPPVWRGARVNPLTALRED